MVRCEGGKKRNIYYVGEAVKQLVKQNEDRFKVGVMRGRVEGWIGKEGGKKRKIKGLMVT